MRFLKGCVFLLIICQQTCFCASSYEEAVKHYEGKNYKQALKDFMALAKAGDVPAIYNLGCMHQNGEGVEPDLIKALEYYKIAKEKGHLNSAKNIEIIETYFKENPDEKRKALEEYNKANFSLALVSNYANIYKKYIPNKNKSPFASDDDSGKANEPPETHYIVVDYNKKFFYEPENKTLVLYVGSRGRPCILGSIEYMRHVNSSRGITSPFENQTEAAFEKNMEDRMKQEARESANVLGYTFYAPCLHLDLLDGGVSEAQNAYGAKAQMASGILGTYFISCRNLTNEKIMKILTLKVSAGKEEAQDMVENGNFILAIKPILGSYKNKAEIITNSGESPTINNPISVVWAPRIIEVDIVNAFFFDAKRNKKIPTM